MANGQRTYTTTGTTDPIFIPRGGTEKTVRPGENYFLVKVKGAQAAFFGYVWDKVKQLVITSQVSLNHPVLGPEPLRAIRQSRQVHQNRAEQLGLSPNIINLVPATMAHVSISIDFIVDKANRLTTLSSLINDEAFQSAISLAPGAAIAARTIGGISQKVLQAFLPPEEREPILQFSGDFNIGSDDLREGYYAILGTRDDRNPLPRPLPQLQMQEGDLLADGKPVTQWSYVILEVRCIEARTRALHNDAAWSPKLNEVEMAAQQVALRPAGTKREKDQAWNKCLDVLKEAQLLLINDPNYLSCEAQDIIKAVSVYCYEQIYGPASARDTRSGAKGTVSSDLAYLGIAPDADLGASLDRYAEQVARVQRLIDDGLVQ